MENNQQNNRDRKSTNTKNMSITNGYAKIPSAMEVSYWDDMVKLAFSPELPESKRTETRRYDYDNQWITCMTRMKCNELYKAYEDEIIPALKNKEQCRVSVPVAEVNQIAIDTGVSLYDDGECHPFIELVKNIDPNTRISSTTIMYEFYPGEYISNHNPATGDFGERIITHNELSVFMSDLIAFRNASSKAYIHAARCVDRAYKDNINTSLQKIGEKVGADISFRANYRRDGVGHGSIFDNANSSQSQSATPQQYSSLEDLDDLNID